MTIHPHCQGFKELVANITDSVLSDDSIWKIKLQGGVGIMMMTCCWYMLVPAQNCLLPSGVSIEAVHVDVISSLNINSTICVILLLCFRLLTPSPRSSYLPLIYIGPILMNSMKKNQKLVKISHYLATCQVSCTNANR